MATGQRCSDELFSFWFFFILAAQKRKRTTDKTRRAPTVYWHDVWIPAGVYAECNEVQE